MQIRDEHVDKPEIFDAEYKKTITKQPSNLRCFAEFCSALMHRFPICDWRGRGFDALHSACVEFHEFIYRRETSQILVKVYNPTADAHAWSAGNTVVVLCCDDMPFLVDTVRMVIDQADHKLQVIKSTTLTTQRDGGELTALARATQASLSEATTQDNTEAKNNHDTFIYLELNHIADADQRAELERQLSTAVQHCEQVVTSYPILQARLNTTLAELQKIEGAEEECAFLDWMKGSHFTFMGYREFEFDRPMPLGELDPDAQLNEVVAHQAGIFNAVQSKTVNTSAANFAKGEQDFFSSQRSIDFRKSRTRCTVHRSAYADYVIVKKFDDQGRVTGQRCFLGLFTHAALAMSPAEIPLLRTKVANIKNQFDVLPSSHDGKRLARLVDIHPKDELFHASSEQLVTAFAKITELNERDIVRLLMRKDDHGSFVSAIVYLPREYFNTRVRRETEALIGSALQVDDVETTAVLSESKHARLQFVFRLSEKMPEEIDVDSLEKQIADFTLGWSKRVERTLKSKLGEARAEALLKSYIAGVPQSYSAAFSAEIAVKDFTALEALGSDDAISVYLYKNADTPADQLRFRILKRNQPVELSNILPVLENMGLRVICEEPYKINRVDETVFWIYDFQTRLSVDNADGIDFESIKTRFETGFKKVWHGDCESDSFNRLIISAGLDWHQVNLLRAYSQYLKQTLFNVSTDFVADTLVAFPEITQTLLKAFDQKFNPKYSETLDQRSAIVEELCEACAQKLESISNLNQDRVFRKYLELLSASTRVDFYKKHDDGRAKNTITIKLQPQRISDIPEPKPAFEFFVYSARVEGVHLRTSKVARGGLRWSDRKEDYRTEVLGLVKAQQVKNSVIVPSGAKGGFYAKRLPTDSRENFIAEGIEAYKIFISSMLDLTDNILDSKVVKPAGVVPYDGDDAYLVVAADKGTATFSDIANDISASRKHWLGDAFASGGSQGYDHKAMGITAKGAWVSVQRHFRERGIDTQRDNFSVLAIGDMGGDVFGNGMLCSRSLQLVAAFNHLHIFIDPSPDPEASYLERKRLFESPSQAAWSNYDANLISAGGGVFSRSQKYIEFSPELKALLDTKLDKSTPDELIQLLLKAPIDLIWNGGIGTYVKAETESHDEVGDKVNNCLRVNGSELRCQVFGEGGNLGMTQRGRIEFCQHGGACNTDFIDNAAGVDCSDHEVNIKILVDARLASGELDQAERNQLLVDMTESVSELVLSNNAKQTLVLSLAEQEASRRMQEYRGFINYLEHSDQLDRALEFLPSDQDILDRIAKSQALTRPELSVLLSYAKVELQRELIDSDIADDPVCAQSVTNIFPSNLHTSYAEDIQKHKLRKEIIATQLANGLVNELGITAYYRLSQATGSSAEEIVKAYVVAREAFRFPQFKQAVADLDYQIPAEQQHTLLLNVTKRVLRASGWFLKNRRRGIQVSDEIAAFTDALQVVQAKVGELNPDGLRAERWREQVRDYAELGIDSQWHSLLAMPSNLYSGLSVVEVSNVTQKSAEEATLMFFELLDTLKLDNFASQLSNLSVESAWQASARQAYVDDLEFQIRSLSIELLSNTAGESVADKLATWSEQNAVYIDRWHQTASKIDACASVDYAMCAVALRELATLVQASGEA